MQKQKGISTLTGIIIIVVVVVILFGGVFAYQYFATKTQTPITKSQTNSNVQNSNNNLLIGEWDGAANPVLNTKYIFSDNNQIVYSDQNGTSVTGSWEIIHNLTAEHISFPKTVSGESDWN